MTRRSWITLVVVGLLSAGPLATAPSVGAAPEVRTYAISGSISVGGLQLPFPAGTTFTATVDTTTGAFTDGSTSIPVISASTVPQPAEATITDAAPATGTIDPTGPATVNLSLSIALALASPASVCTISPVDIPLSTANPGGSALTGTPPTGTLTAAGYTVPAIPLPAAPPCDNAFAGGTNGFLDLPTTNTTVTVTATLTSPLPSPGPAPVEARPGFTG